MLDAKSSSSIRHSQLTPAFGGKAAGMRHIQAQGRSMTCRGTQGCCLKCAQLGCKGISLEHDNDGERR
eukprot:5965813-Pyramimonas_sp.AAC.1